MNRRDFLVSAVLAAGGLLAYGKLALSGSDAATPPHHFPVRTRTPSGTRS